MAQRRPHLSIIIVAWNCWEATKACLESLAEHTPGEFFEVLLVDNGSTDATPAQAPDLGARLFPGRFVFLRQERNLNFGPGCNVGAARASGDLLFFLNNDTEVTPGWSRPLLEAAKSLPRWGGLGPLLVYPDDPLRGSRVQHLGVAFGPDLALSHLYARFPAIHPVVRRERGLQALTGAALLVERGLFQECDGFHPNYANGYEDLDLCCRLRRRGRTLHCLPESVIVHHEGLTPGRLDQDARNAALLMERCAGCFLPDLHAHAERDGYELRLDPWLAPRLCLRSEVEQELDREHAQAPFEELVRVLEREPLWESGRERLAELAPSPEAALGLLDDLCFFHPTPARLVRLKESAGKQGDQALVRAASLRLESMRSALANVAGLVAKARALRDWAAKAGDRDMQALFDDWLTVRTDPWA